MFEPSLFPHGKIFNVAVPSGEKVPPGEVVPPGCESFDLAVVEFKDDGCLVADGQKDAMLDCITAARGSNPNGALVVVFVHGWHASSTWEDYHFAGFRKVLVSLALREAERWGGNVKRGRRVVGVYLAWQGNPACWPRIVGNSAVSFWNRYGVAKRIADGEAMRGTIREIVARTKGPPPNESQPASPLVLVGHSMGALMLEKAFLALLIQGAAQKADQPDSCVQVTAKGQSVSFPDVVIGLNSAGDSRITKAIISEFEQWEMSKSVRAEKISYSPPLFVSVTAAADWQTRVIWRLVPLNWGRWTVGHDRSLFTHTFDTMRASVPCLQRNRLLDFGQNWACLRPPQPAVAPSPEFWIDLPQQDRLVRDNPQQERSNPDESKHTRYRLTPRGGNEQKHLVWIFQVPPLISSGHNDIFSFRCSLLMLALIQISGAVMSLAEEWRYNFEPLSYPDPDLPPSRPS